MDAINEAKQLIHEMNRYYEARAPWHDEYMGYESSERMEALLNPVIETIEPLIGGKAVLEIACGTGSWTQILARRARSVVAADISPTALQIARQKLSGCTNVTVLQADAYDPIEVGGRYDVLFAADWWSHIPVAMVPSFLATVTARLRPGGTALFLDMLANEYFEQEQHFYDRDGNRVSIRRLPDGSEYRVVKNFPGESELRRMLADMARTIVYYEFASLQRWLVVVGCGLGVDVVV